MAPSALAATPAVIPDSGNFEFEQQDDGTWKAEFGLTNTTEAKIAGLEAAPVDEDLGCTLGLKPTELAPGERADVELTAPDGCKVPEDGLDFTVTAGAQVLDLTAAPKKEAPNWGILEWLMFGLAAGFVLVAVLYFFWGSFDNSPTAVPHHLREPLSQLDKAWSFKESWMTNVTLGATVLVAFLGSTDVVKAALGDDSEPSIALVTVGAAAVAGLAAAGQLFVLATRKKGADGWITVGGLLGGAVFTLGATLGQIWVLKFASEKFELGGAEDFVLISAVLATILVLVYGFRSLWLILEQGTTEAEPGVSEADLQLAVDLRGQGVQLDDIALEIKVLREALKQAAIADAAGTSAGDAGLPPLPENIAIPQLAPSLKRSALL